MENKIFRVVLDTNVIVSSAIFDGKPESVINLCFLSKVRNVISLSIVLECIDVFANLLMASAKWFIHEIRLKFQEIKPITEFWKPPFVAKRILLLQVTRISWF